MICVASISIVGTTIYRGHLYGLVELAVLSERHDLPLACAVDSRAKNSNTPGKSNSDIDVTASLSLCHSTRTVGRVVARAVQDARFNQYHNPWLDLRNAYSCIVKHSAKQELGATLSRHSLKSRDVERENMSDQSDDLFNLLGREVSMRVNDQPESDSPASGPALTCRYRAPSKDRTESALF